MLKFLLLIFLFACSRSNIETTNVEMKLPQLYESKGLTQNHQYSVSLLQPFTIELDDFEIPEIVNSDCIYRTAQIETQKIWQLTGDPPSDSDNFMYSEKYGVVYRLNNKKLTAYKFSVRQQQLQQIGFLNFISQQCTKTWVLTHDEQYLFVFSCQKVIRVSVKKILTELVAQQFETNFSGTKIINADGLFVWLSEFQGAKIFGMTPDDKITDLGILQNAFDATDLAYQNGQLFLLKKHKEIHVYNRLGNQKFIENFVISLQNVSSGASNLMLKLWNKNIYIYSQEQGNQFITQLQFRDQKVSLIRFFKGFDQFINFQIYKNHLLIATDHSINLLEINKDPRTIKRIFNGITNNHFENQNKLIKIDDQLFFSVTKTAINLIRLKFQKAYIYCKFIEKGLEAINITTKCEENEEIVSHPFNEHCSALGVLAISVNSSDSSDHKYAILVVFLFCIAVILFMMAWREDKRQIIEKMINQINRIGGRGIQQIEFVEEHHSRENQWDDIKQNYDVDPNLGQKHQHQQQQSAQQQGSKENNQEEEKNGNVISTERQMITN